MTTVTVIYFMYHVALSPFGDYCLHMVTTQQVAQRVTEALGDRPVKWLAEETLIPYTTLTRRLGDGNFTTAELFKIAAVLELEPAALIGTAA